MNHTISGELLSAAIAQNVSGKIKSSADPS